MENHNNSQSRLENPLDQVKSSLEKGFGRDTRAPNVALLHDTILSCFEEVLDTAGPGVKGTVSRILSMKGITESDISTRFAEVEKIITDLFGAGGRLMIVSTLSKVCDEYSLRLDISYAASPHDRLEQLKDRILVEKRLPKHYRRAIDTTGYEDTGGTHAPWSD